MRKASPHLQAQICFSSANFVIGRKQIGLIPGDGASSFWAALSLWPLRESVAWGTGRAAS